MAPQRETPRRAARSIQRYGHIDAESDGLADSDPDFHLSDSDDDPDFNPINRKVLCYEKKKILGGFSS